MIAHLIRKVWPCVLPFCGIATPVNASHFFGSEIRYQHVQGYTYAIEVLSYTNPGVPADQPAIVLHLGDGTLDTVPRTSYQDIVMDGVCSAARLSSYQVEHTYAGPGAYVIHTQEVNRTSGIINIPNSVNIPACISALLVISPVLGTNHSIRFNNPQILTTWDGNTLVHDPDATDADGDSLSFELVAPLGAGCMPIPGYSFPQGVNYAWLDPASGVFLWDYPPIIGIWNLTIRGSEWRNGQLIGQVTRDMTICVQPFQVGIAEGLGGPMPGVAPSITDGPVWVTNPMDGPLQAEVLSMTGAVRLQATVQAGRHPLDLSGLANGMYLVRLTGGERMTAAFRVVKH